MNLGVSAFGSTQSAANAVLGALRSISPSPTEPIVIKVRKKTGEVKLQIPDLNADALTLIRELTELLHEPDERSAGA